MRMLVAAAMAAPFLLVAPAAAETVDIATVKCSELGNMAQDEATFLFTWLLGYASGVAGTSTMDLSAMEQIGKDIGEYCAANPDVGILSAANEVMGE